MSWGKRHCLRRDLAVFLAVSLRGEETISGIYAGCDLVFDSGRNLTKLETRVLPRTSGFFVIQPAHALSLPPARVLP